jgi:hypothetical protein
MIALQLQAHVMYLYKHNQPTSSAISVLVQHQQLRLLLCCVLNSNIKMAGSHVSGTPVKACKV